MSLLECLDKTKKECDNFKEDIKLGIKDPKYILTDLFKNNNESLELLLFSINKYGDFTPEQFQEQLFSVIIPYLSRFVSDKEISFNYNEDTFGSFIAFNYRESPIFFINIYNGEYIVRENEELNSLSNETDKIDEEIDLLKMEIEDKKVLYENPLLLGGANILKIANVFMKKDKYKKQVLDEINNLNMQISVLNNKKNTVDFKKEESENNFLEISCIQERLSKKFERIGYSRIK